LPRATTEPLRNRTRSAWVQTRPRSTFMSVCPRLALRRPGVWRSFSRARIHIVGGSSKGESCHQKQTSQLHRTQSLSPRPRIRGNALGNTLGNKRPRQIRPGYFPPGETGKGGALLAGGRHRQAAFTPGAALLAPAPRKSLTSHSKAGIPACFRSSLRTGRQNRDTWVSEVSEPRQRQPPNRP